MMADMEAGITTAAMSAVALQATLSLTSHEIRTLTYIIAA